MLETSNAHKKAGDAFPRTFQFNHVTKVLT